MSASDKKGNDKSNKEEVGKKSVSVAQAVRVKLEEVQFVSFCGIQVVTRDDCPDLKDIEFNRGKSLEDLFDGLRIDPPRSHSEAVAATKKARGNRIMGDITVKTYTGFTGGASAGAVEAAADQESASNANSREQTPLTEGASSASEATNKGEASKKSKESTPASATSSSSDSPDHINFISGNPFVEVSKGVLHLYKENQTTSLEEGVIRSHMMVMIGVPSKIKSPDLLQFTAPCHSNLEMIRIIQDSSPNQYMVLLRFRCQEAADEFYQAFNGQRFNSLEADVCSLVYVSKVETCKESEYYPMAGHTELPVCSICLEREFSRKTRLVGIYQIRFFLCTGMDESISTVLTILCNHSFHGSCLAQWEDSTCPVCRYVQTPEIVAEQRCSDCQSSEDLWICLVCGYVGCGR